MSAPVVVPEPGRRRFRVLRWSIALLLFASFAGIVLYLNSEAFHAALRARIVTEMERATGGKVELESLEWRLISLHFEARGLTIHGREPAGEVPYFHAAQITADARLVSLLSSRLALRKVTIDHPTLHLIFNPDGSTNQPSPTPVGDSERLFDLAVQDLEIAAGTLLLEREPIPFELKGDKFSAALIYSPQERGYDGTIAFALLSARWRGIPQERSQVELRVLVRQKEAEIKSLKIAAEPGTLQARGTLHNYRSPELSLQYQASLNLSQLARKTGVSQLSKGKAEVKGSFDYRNRRFASKGNLTFREVEWKDQTVRVSEIEGASAFSLTPEQVSFSHVTARMLGGNVEGEAQIGKWNERSKGTIALRISGCRLKRAADAILLPELPLRKLELAGNVSGEAKIAWTGKFSDATVDFHVESSPPPDVAPEQVPVSATLRATYHGNQKILEVAGFSASTRALHVNASGKLGSETTQAKIALTSTSLAELKPMLAALSPGTRIPVLLEGRAAFNGTISGSLNALSTRGRLELENFDTELAPLELSAGKAKNTPPRRLQRVHWDSLMADVTYSPAMLGLQNGALRRGRAVFQLSGSAGLRQGTFDENKSQVNFTLRVQEASLEDLELLAGLKYPLSGNITGEVRAYGTPAALQGGGSLQVSKFVAYGEPFRLFRCQLQFAGKDVQLSNIVLAHNGAQLTGSYGYNLGSESFRFDLNGDNIELGTLQRFALPRLSVEGKAGFHLTGSGTAEAQSLNGRLDLRNLVLNRELVGNMEIVAETHGNDLALRGRSHFESAELTVDGKVQLRGDWPGQMRLVFSHLDFDPLIRAYLQGQVTGHSSIAGSVDIHGPFRRPRDLVITGSADQLSADIQNVKLHNESPVRFSMDTEVARLEQFHLVGENTDVFVQANVGVAGEHTLDLHTRGSFNLKLLRAYNPQIIAEGPVTFSLDAGGVLARPQWGGRFDLHDANISLADLPNGLSQINGTLEFQQDRIQIEKLTARSGGGELKVTGFLAYRNGLYWDLTATGKDVRLRYPPGVSSSADATLRYTGTEKNAQLTGDVLVTRFGMNRRFDFASYLEQSKRSPVLTTRNPYLDNLRLDVHITSTPELQVETSLARVSGDIDVRLRGTASRPALVGRVNIAEGDIFFNGTKYHLERGDISFTNPVSIEPVINMEMSTRVQGYDITITLHGALTGGKSLSMKYRSDPPLSNSDIIALLAFGHTRSQEVYNASRPGQAGNDAADASNAILGQALNSTVTDRVQRLFGASRVKVDPQFIGAENNPSARVTIEQSINNNITLTYVTSLTQSADTVVQVEYQVNKNISVVAVRNQNGILGFDVHIRRRRK